MTKQPTAVPALDHHAALTTIDAAAYLNIKPGTLEQWRWQGNGPRYLKLNRAVRYRLSDLDAYLDARSFGSTTEAQALAN